MLGWSAVVRQPEMDFSVARLFPLNENVTALDYHQNAWPVPSYARLPVNGCFRFACVRDSFYAAAGQVSCQEDRAVGRT